jgi:hypothetical protein
MIKYARVQGLKILPESIVYPGPKKTGRLLGGQSPVDGPPQGRCNMLLPGVAQIVIQFQHPFHASFPRGFIMNFKPSSSACQGSPCASSFLNQANRNSHQKARCPRTWLETRCLRFHIPLDKILPVSFCSHMILILRESKVRAMISIRGPASLTLCPTSGQTWGRWLPPQSQTARATPFAI